MNRRTLSIALLIPFALLTLYALAIDGYMGILDHQLATPAGWQVLADLVVALLLVLTWLIPDARRSGRNPWPWVVLTLSSTLSRPDSGLPNDPDYKYARPGSLPTPACLQRLTLFKCCDSVLRQRDDLVGVSLGNLAASLS